MRQYLDLVRRILTEGELVSTRTGIETLSLFGAMCQYDLRQGFPLLTTKKVLFETVVDELLWFIKGGHNIYDAGAPKRIWDAWASQDGELGRIYGVEWRTWRGYSGIAHDQLSAAIVQVKKQPNSRRNLVSAWNAAEIYEGNTNFPPCHTLFQLRRFGARLDLAMYQRSCDMALGVPFNIASYALLLTMIAHECHLQPGIFTHFLGDAHVYVNHVDGLRKQLAREPYPLPVLTIMAPAGTKVVDMTKEHIALTGYAHHSFIRFEVAV